jgi:magnesium transporter
MDVWLVTGGGVEQKPADELEMLIALGEGIVWVDILIPDEEAVRVLSDVFGFHRLAVRDCVERNQVP